MSSTSLTALSSSYSESSWSSSRLSELDPPEDQGTLITILVPWLVFLLLICYTAYQHSQDPISWWAFAYYMLLTVTFLLFFISQLKERGPESGGFATLFLALLLTGAVYSLTCASRIFWAKQEP